MVESSLKEVDAGVIEAAKSMGASTWQIIVKVLLPEAKPSLLVGAAISVTTILGYSAMAGFTGGGGLGDIAIRYGYHRYQTDMMMVTVVLLVIIVQLINFVFRNPLYIIDLITGAVPLILIEIPDGTPVRLHLLRMLCLKNHGEHLPVAKHPGLFRHHKLLRTRIFRTVNRKPAHPPLAEARLVDTSVRRRRVSPEKQIF